MRSAVVLGDIENERIDLCFEFLISVIILERE